MSLSHPWWTMLSPSRQGSDRGSTHQDSCARHGTGPETGRPLHEGEEAGDNHRVDDDEVVAAITNRTRRWTEAMSRRGPWRRSNWRVGRWRHALSTPPRGRGGAAARADSARRQMQERSCVADVAGLGGGGGCRSSRRRRIRGHEEDELMISEEKVDLDRRGGLGVGDVGRRCGAGG